jgi:hypothetical protein
MARFKRAASLLSMPVIAPLQADRALRLDDLLERHRRQLIAALARRVAVPTIRMFSRVDPAPLIPA